MYGLRLASKKTNTKNWIIGIDDSFLQTVLLIVDNSAKKITGGVNTTNIIFNKNIAPYQSIFNKFFIPITKYPKTKRGLDKELEFVKKSFCKKDGSAYRMKKGAMSIAGQSNAVGEWVIKRTIETTDKITEKIIFSNSLYFLCSLLLIFLEDLFSRTYRYENNIVITPTKNKKIQKRFKTKAFPKT